MSSVEMLEIAESCTYYLLVDGFLDLSLARISFGLLVI